MSAWHRLDLLLARLRPHREPLSLAADALVIAACWHITYLFRLGFERWATARPGYDNAVAAAVVSVYLLTFVAHEITDKLILLQTARGDLDSAWGVLEKSPAQMSPLPSKPLFVAGLASLGLELPVGGPAGEVARIAESVADLEYAVRTHELFKRWFNWSLKLHIVLSVILYVLLALHIGSGIYFGLRWLR